MSRTHLQGPESFAGQGPDLMNDPAFATNTLTTDGSAPTEPETCRICRTEGTEKEPLFYPCKCSGSIKFVHQECLMEWLSHSQKKYCELCKTSFRFTKFYDPHMPKTLPTAVFLRHLIVHGLRTLVTWARFILVCFVWLGWLPWSMRTIWRFLFWLGDGGWATWSNEATGLSEAQQALAISQSRLKDVEGALTSASRAALSATSSGFETTTTSIASSIPSFLTPISQTLNMSLGEPLVLKFLRKSLAPIGRRATLSALSINGTDNTTGTTRSSLDFAKPSFLSEIGFLKSLTRSSTFNALLIDTLEGQIITLLVVTAFILVFLIREWVVQQQPGFNMAGAANAEPAGLRAEIVLGAGQGDLPERLDHEIDAEAQAPEGQHVEAEPRVHRTPLDRPESDGIDGLGLDRDRNLPAERDRPHAVPRRRNRFVLDEQNATIDTSSSEYGRHTDDARSTALSHHRFGESSAREEVFQFRGSGSDADTISLQRPIMPTRNATSKAAEIRRAIEEEKVSDKQQWPGLDVFMNIWHRAEGNPENVLKIIEQENRTSDLGWIVEAMKRLQESDPKDLQTHLQLRVPVSGVTKTSLGPSEQASSSSDGSSWLDVAQMTDDDDVSTEPLEDGSDEKQKGKSKAIEYAEETRVPTDEWSSRSSKVDEESPEASSTRRTPDVKEDKTNAPEDLIINIDFQLVSKSKQEQRATDGVVGPVISPSTSSVQESSASAGPELRIGAEQDNIDSSSRQTDQPDPLMGAPLDQAPEGSQVMPAEPEAHREQQGILNGILAWLWGDPTAEQPEEPVAQENEGGVAPGPADEDRIRNGENNNVALDAAALGLDAEAIEDGEDFEGVMELIGMHGPLTGLFQNGMFSAVLISATVCVGVWFPYLWGKTVLLVLANPVSWLIRLPIRWFSICADIFVDFTLFVCGSSVYGTIHLLKLLMMPIYFISPGVSGLGYINVLMDATRTVYEGAFLRMTKMVTEGSFDLSGADWAVFSIVSHEALQTTKSRIVEGFSLLWTTLVSIERSASFSSLSANVTPADIMNALFWPLDSPESLSYFLTTLKGWILTTSTWLRMTRFSMTLEIAKRTQPYDLSLAYWGAGDRTLAILSGYAFVSLLGALYLKKGGPISTSAQGKKVEGVIADILNQAGGVLKVILIISIEMILFPLYCGLLLDMALLPLFENASLSSRINFTANAPWTSIFVHWFVGTCYMFHFALFVSMCRKILRSGVLYFIRDPDDPTFHPVRDVLERSVTTQLRKITFSALVYGALVIICLGSVVWGIFYAIDGVLPIHWSSNEPVLEFPVDLLFYNFLMPLAVRFFKPSAGLNTMYTWWFRKCARALRLTWFLFDDRRKDEEGREVGNSRSYIMKFFPARTDPSAEETNKRVAENLPFELSPESTNTSFERDGRYVRAPGSDSVRIPKGGPVFLEVDELNNRIDGMPEVEAGLHARNTGQFSLVYIPPYFRIRIGLFIIAIWLFAAATGVGVTIIPLIFGRIVFAILIPNHLRINDVYAFSIGAYILAGVFYAGMQYGQSITLAGHYFRLPELSHLVSNARIALVRAIRLTYVYGMFAILIPSLCAALMEAYLIIPLHTYIEPNQPHIVHFVQDWTLGVLYLKLAAGGILWYENSRPARQLQNVIRNGWLDPDVGVATRSFVLPITIAVGVALLLPLGLGKLLNTFLWSHWEDSEKAIVYRYTYPMVLSGCCLAALIWLLMKQLSEWRLRVKDEVYLRGERLHNLGEKTTEASMAGLVLGAATEGSTGQVVA